MDDDLKQRAAARRARITITKRRLGEEDDDAEFVVVGGHAVAFHGHPRATKGEQDRADVALLERATKVP